MDVIYPQLDVPTCRACKLRIFNQCKEILPNGEPRDDPQPVSAEEPAREILVLTPSKMSGA
jgi:hypothetical protein